jgi:hypothetical protein
MDNKFRQPSAMPAAAHFAQVPGINTQRSKFNMDSTHKTTFDAGKLVPVLCKEVLPGDTFTVNGVGLVRLATPKAPFMDNLSLDVHYFFVPDRLLWTNFQKFMGERINPDDDPTAFTRPVTTINLENLEPDDLACYFGLPKAGSGVTATVQAAPFRAYALVYDEWYRDQNLQDSIEVPRDDGPDNQWDGMKCLSRNKRPDYFTTCLPWPQKGDAITISLGDSAPVELANNVNIDTNAVHVTGSGTTTLKQVLASSNYLLTADGAAGGDATILNTMSPSEFHAGGATADLSSATAITINDLRLAIQMQRMLERDARGGTRYIEIVLSQFGVKSDDARLQRPEFLGQGTCPININPIASTVATDDIPQANLAAIGTGMLKGGFEKSFTEHGWIIAIASARADLSYQQGIERMWFRQTREDHYMPVFAHLGEQAVLGREICYSGSSYDTSVFGYQERWAEYRYGKNMITGLFNSTMPTPLDFWHLAQEFSIAPVLNDSFITENPPIDRVISVPSEPHFLADFYFSIKADRVMPLFSVPDLVDRL